jgi:hypothetical protein
MDPDYHMAGRSPWPNEVPRSTKVLHSILEWVNEKSMLIDEQHQRTFKSGILHKIRKNLKLIARISSALYFLTLTFAALWYNANFVISLISVGLAVLAFYEVGK